MKEPTRPTMHRHFDMDKIPAENLNCNWDISDSIAYTARVEKEVENDLVYLPKDLRPDYVFVVIRDICVTYFDPETTDELMWRFLGEEGIKATRETCKMCLDMMCDVIARFDIKLEPHHLNILKGYEIFNPDMLGKKPNSNFSEVRKKWHKDKFQREKMIFKQYETRLLDLGLIIKEGEKYKVGNVLEKGLLAHLLKRLIYPQKDPQGKRKSLSWKRWAETFGLDLKRPYSTKAPLTEDEEQLINGLINKVRESLLNAKI